MNKLEISQKVRRGASWIYFYSTERESNDMSGWKFHIFGQNVEDSIDVAQRMQPVLQKYKMYMKVASNNTYIAGIGDPSHKQYGKCGTMYIPPFVFKDGRTQEFLDDVKNALKGYEKKGAIFGDKSIDDTIHYRYELCKPINIEEGINHGLYSILYEPNRGEYNILDNKDPFEHITI